MNPTIDRHTGQKLLPNWHAFNLHPKLLKSIHNKRYISPTPIQKKALPLAMANRDVVGIAETVSPLLPPIYPGWS